MKEINIAGHSEIIIERTDYPIERCKSILDALNGRYYKDDSQIYSLCIEKRYGDEDSVKVKLEYE